MKTNSQIVVISRIHLLLVIGVSMCMLACTSKTKVLEKKSELTGTEKLLVVPFENLSKLANEEGMIRCPTCGGFFVSGQVPQAVNELMTEHLLSFLNDNRRFKIISSYPSITVRSKTLSSETLLSGEHKALISAGRKAKTDLVLAGYIFRFKQRTGTRYTVQTPASVAFGIHLISVADGSSLWSGHYDETQRSLSEDLFRLKIFLRRKWKWITAEEMAISALDELLETFPNP